MSKNSHGMRAGTKSITKKKIRNRGMPSAGRVLQTFNIGAKVQIEVESAITKGMPYLKYNGRVGTIERAQGGSYIVKIKDGNKPKEVIVAPVHLVASG